MIVVVCPGQGSQTPGFLDPWLAEPRFRDQLTASPTRSASTSSHTAPCPTPTPSATPPSPSPSSSRPACSRSRALLADGRREQIDGVAGHSVGEFTAAAAAGILTERMPSTGPRTRCRHGRRGALAQTGMSAVIGADEAELLAKLDELGPAPGQLQRRRPDRRRRRARRSRRAEAEIRRPAPGSSRSRSPAHSTPGICRLRWRRCARSRRHSTPHDPTLTIWTNHDGTVVTCGTAIRRPPGRPGLLAGTVGL